MADDRSGRQRYRLRGSSRNGRRVVLLGLILFLVSFSLHGISGRSAVEAATSPKGCCYFRQCRGSGPACTNATNLDTCVASCRSAGCQSLVFGVVDTCQHGCGGMPVSN